MEKKKQKKKRKKTAKRRGRKPAVSAKKAEEMFILFLNNIPLKTIGDKYGVSITAVQGARDRYDWIIRKDAIEKEVFDHTDKELINRMITQKEKQLECMGMMLANLYKDIMEDYENRGKVGYIRKIKVEDVGDVERLFKTYFMVVNQGVDKSETTQNKNVTLQLSKEEKKMLLKAMAEGKADIEHPTGNA